jgi:adenosylmethionine-8-amino-7-oxononanoate aminotransferase
MSEAVTRGSAVTSEGTNVFFRDVRRYHPVIVRGEGVYLYDRDGRRYIDGCSGALVVNIGHGVKEIAAVLGAQAERVAFTHLSRFASEPVIELSRKVARLAPGDLDRVYMVSGGSEGTETAAKMARQYFLERDGKSSKHKVISRWYSFHGNTLGALSMTGHVPRRRRFDPMLIDFPHVTAAYCYRCAFSRSYPGCDLECARDLERGIQRVGPENVAAFIAEPVVGAASGALVPPPEYFPLVREICDRYDVLFIDDEVMAGFGRTGKYFAIDHWDVIPDIIVAAKGMSAGYVPLGAVIAREGIHDAFLNGSGKFVHGHTYGGNPLACAVGCAVLDYLERERVVERAAEAGEYLLERLGGLKRHRIVGDVRGLGLMCGIEFVRDKPKKLPFDPQLGAGELFTVLALERGAVVYPGSGTYNGVAGDHVLIGPPLTISRPEIDELVDILDQAAAEAGRRLP